MPGLFPNPQAKSNTTFATSGELEPTAAAFRPEAGRKARVNAGSRAFMSKVQLFMGWRLAKIRSL
jgi:hypothetical protein